MATTILLAVNCLLVLGIYVLLLYIAWIFFHHFTRKDRGLSPLATLSDKLESFFDFQSPVSTREAMERRWNHLANTALGLPSPIDEWVAEESNLTVDLNQSHELQTPQGTVLGACGVRTVAIGGYNTSRYDRVYEVWLEEKGGGENVSRFLVSNSIAGDESLQAELAGRGEIVEQSRLLVVETQSLYMQVRLEYCYFDQAVRTLEGDLEEWLNKFEFSIWPKGMTPGVRVTKEWDITQICAPSVKSPWILPDTSAVLDEIPWVPQTKETLRQQMTLLETALEGLDAPASVVDVKSEPYVTTFVVVPRPAKRRGRARAVRLTRFKEIANELALDLGVSQVEIQDATDGNRIQVRIPNEGLPRTFHQIIRSDTFSAIEHPLRLPLGHGRPGPPGVTSLVELKSLLVGGCPWTAKDAFLDTLICSLLIKHTPAELNLVLIGSARKPFRRYDGIPHLWDAITREVGAEHIIDEVFKEFERRRDIFQEEDLFSLDLLNNIYEISGEQKLPAIVLIVSEIGDLINLYSSQAAHQLARMADLADFTGIYVILATEKPLNAFPELFLPRIHSKLSFAVKSLEESWSVYQWYGAERLTDPCEFFINPPGSLKHLRYRLAMVSQGEIERIVEYWKTQPALLCES